MKQSGGAKLKKQPQDKMRDKVGDMIGDEVGDKLAHKLGDKAVDKVRKTWETQWETKLGHKGTKSGRQIQNCAGPTGGQEGIHSGIVENTKARDMLANKLRTKRDTVETKWETSRKTQPKF